MIYNPVKIARGGLAAAVAAEERLHGWAASEWFETTRDDPGTGVGRRAVARGPAVVIVAGGDGTVRAVAEALEDSGVPLALVPVGTGNLLARNLGMPVSDPPFALRVAFGGSDRSIDVATVDLRRADGSTHRHAFVVMAGVGLDARMAEDTDGRLKKRIGWLAYADPIARSVVGGERVSLRYGIDGGRGRSVDAHTVIVGNCGTLAGGVLLLPDAVVDDGLLDLVILRPRRGFDWALVGARLLVHGLFHRTRAGRWVIAATPQLHALQYAQARTIDVEFDLPQMVELDGDGFGLVTRLSWSVQHAALTVKVAPGLAATAADVSSTAESYDAVGA